MPGEPTHLSRQAENRTRKTEQLLPEWIDARTIILFLLGLSVALSAYKGTRLSFGDFLVHPYLVFLVLLLAVCGLGSLRRLPRSMRTPMLAFAGIFVVVLLAGGYSSGFLSELAKVIALVATIWVLAVAPTKRIDARAGMLGLCAAIAIVSFEAMVGHAATAEGVNPFESVGSRTAYSLYALPAMLIAGHMTIDRWTPRVVRFLFSLCLVVIVIGMFSSGNRSGYLGAVVIAVMLAARGRRPRDVVIVVGVGILAFLLLTEYGSILAFQTRFDETLEGETADDFRMEMLDASIAIGEQNPILGIGPQNVRSLLGVQLQVRDETLDPHNIFGFLWAGGGVPLLATFCWWLVAWLRRPKEFKLDGPASDEEKDGRSLLRMMIILMVVRGLFSQDALNTPGFMIGIGLSAGLMLQAAGGQWFKIVHDPPRKLPDLFALEREQRRSGP